MDNGLILDKIDKIFLLVLLKYYSNRRHICFSSILIQLFTYIIQTYLIDVIHLYSPFHFLCIQLCICISHFHIRHTYDILSKDQLWILHMKVNNHKDIYTREHSETYSRGVKPSKSPLVNEIPFSKKSPLNGKYPMLLYYLGHTVMLSRVLGRLCNIFYFLLLFATPHGKKSSE